MFGSYAVLIFFLLSFSRFFFLLSFRLSLHVLMHNGQFGGIAVWYLV